MATTTSPAGMEIETGTGKHEGVQSQSREFDVTTKDEKTYPMRCVIVAALISIVFTALIAGIIGAEIALNSGQCDDDSDGGTSSSALEVDDSDAYDVVIIGAGITGLTNLYILSTASDDTHETLMVERNNRIGGRTFSSHLKYNGSSISFEMGAMRFIHWEIQSQFLHHLGLCDKIIGFEDTTSYANSWKNNDEGFYLWRNHRKVIEDINSTNYWPTVYNFNDRVECSLASLFVFVH